MSDQEAIVLCPHPCDRGMETICHFEWPVDCTKGEYSLGVDDQDGGHLLESAHLSRFLSRFSPHNIQIHIP